MIIKRPFKQGVDIIYYKDYTTVTNSYLLDDDDIERVATEIAYSRSCKYDWKCDYFRNEESYIREIKAHNRLYRLGLWKSHTINTDLEENIDIIHKVIWWFIGR
jgi:hypothetical protein